MRERCCVSFDETNQALDGLFQADRQRKESYLALLRSAVQQLAVVAPGDEPLDILPGGGRGATAPAPTRNFVHLPQRTTHGGNFGPAVRAKLRAQALAKR
jgi:hypothetical protein